MIDTAKLAVLAAKYDAGDPRRVQHLMKVYAFCRLIGQAEGLDERTQNLLEAAALLHDIGIHEAERKHGSSAGKWQEQEGPAAAAPLLAQAGADFSLALKVMVSAEVIAGTYTSLGGMINEASMYLMVAEMFALTIVALVFGGVCEYALGKLTKITDRWNKGAA